MVLEIIQVRVDANVRLHELVEDLPCNLDVLGVDEDGADEGLEDVAEYLQAVFVEAVEVEGALDFLGAATKLRQQLLNSLYVLFILSMK